MSTNMKLGKDTGSLMNHVMSTSDQKPEVGKGATILHWTDREAWEVIKVSKSGKEVTIQKYDAERIDKNGMSEVQDYKYEKLSDRTMDLVFRWSSWKAKRTAIHFTEEFLEKHSDNYKSINDEYQSLGGKYDNNGFITSLIEGVTKEVSKYGKVKIIWGVKREYYDYSF